MIITKGEIKLTVQQAIERANEMRQGNASSDETKIRWLSELDGIIYNDVILTHHKDAKPFTPYEDGSVELIAAFPYDVVYVYWLMAQIDLAASELNRYNNSMELFNKALNDYKAWYNRNNMPIAKPSITICIDRRR